MYLADVRRNDPRAILQRNCIGADPLRCVRLGIKAEDEEVGGRVGGVRARCNTKPT